MNKRNPVAFYFGTAQSDWTFPQNDELWRDGVKTLFDPCPAGWRVPKNGKEQASLWSAFTMANGPWNGTDVGPSGGRTWSAPETYGGSAWYPATGMRYPSTGTFYESGNGHFIWYSGTNGTEGNDSGFYLGIFYVAADDPRAFGFSVRCVRE
ncbi:hypothetical protein [uncultured Rikenella sp.]|uniref:hypothetical protein n=1 Tax=uncultured Rikenella sp. TaxID=368003 RepID=UPI0026238E27|nr:hypothetical protein [uncultured Rikenella sp.]